MTTDNTRPYYGGWRLIAYGDRHTDDPLPPLPSEWALTIETMSGELWVKVLGQLYRFPLDDVLDVLAGRSDVEARGAVDWPRLWPGVRFAEEDPPHESWGRQAWRYLTGSA